MLDNIRLSRCERHDSPGCVECRWLDAEGRWDALQAMHDLCVWMLCQGYTDFHEVHQ